MTLPERQLDELARFAEQLAERSRPILRRWFLEPPPIEEKADLTPVTRADREAEAALRKLIGETNPDHGIIGEEHGAERTEAAFVWVIDPIDGTKRFITGEPWFGTLIALTFQGRPILGIVDMPMLDQRWIGLVGRPTLFRQGNKTTKAKTRRCPEIGDAILSATSPHMFTGNAASAFDRLRGAVKFPLYGGECYAYGLLANGRFDIVAEADMAIYDYLAQVPIIEGAGGKAMDWSGNPLGLNSGAQVLALGDPRLQDPVLALLTGD